MKSENIESVDSLPSRICIDLSQYIADGGGVHLPFIPANVVGGGQPALSYDCHYNRNPFT